MLRIMFVGFVAGAACASSMPKRWQAYSGCTEAQCQTWYEECRAECLQDGEGTVVTCQTICQTKKDSCGLACAG